MHDKMIERGYTVVPGYPLESYRKGVVRIYWSHVYHGFEWSIDQPGNQTRSSREFETPEEAADNIEALRDVT
jgi:hypothetical protein